MSRTGDEKDAAAPAPGAAPPKPAAEDRATAGAGDEDVDETSAGGLRYPDEGDEADRKSFGANPVEPGP